MRHESVLLKEVVDGLEIHSGDAVIDMTLGSGGHSSEIIKSASNLKMIMIDADRKAILRSRNRIEALPESKSCELHFVESYYHDLQIALNNLSVSKVDKILFDLGLSSEEIEESGRGFSFRKDEPILMTLSEMPAPWQKTALEIVNTFGERELASIIAEYGEEKFATRIAEAIYAKRQSNMIRTSKELADIIYYAVPFWYRHQKIHPATKTFQAIRIATNNELEHLESTLENAFEKLEHSGRIAVISFHSLEDRIVKNVFRKQCERGFAELINKKPLVPTREEVKNNPRSRSAKLRIIKKI